MGCLKKLNIFPFSHQLIIIIRHLFCLIVRVASTPVLRKVTIVWLGLTWSRSSSWFGTPEIFSCQSQPI